MNYQIPKGYVKVGAGESLKKGDVAVVWNDGKASTIALYYGQKVKVGNDEMVLRRAKQ